MDCIIVARLEKFDSLAMHEWQLSAVNQISFKKKKKKKKGGLTWLFGGKGVLGDDVPQKDDVMPR